MADLNYSKPKEARDQAQEAIRQIGTNAIPFLMEELNILGKLWEKVGVTNFDNSPETVARAMNVRHAFETLGPIAKPAVPALVDLLNSATKGANDAAAYALTQIDPQIAAIALTQASTNGFIGARLAAANNLYLVRSNADIAVPNMIRCLKDASPEKGSVMLRGFAAITLGAIHARADVAVPALVEALSDKESAVRFESARALGKFGQAAIFAVPALQQATNDPERHVRAVADLSLKQIQGQSQ